MNLKSILIGLLFLSLSSSVNAALTPISHSPDLNNEPSLIGSNPYPGNLNPSVLETLYGETNLRRIDDNSDISFRHDGTQATVKAVARFNNPSIEEVLGYSEPGMTEWSTALRFQRVAPNFLFPTGYNPPTLGTGLIPLSVSGPEFELRIQSRAYSNPQRNANNQDMMVTFEIIGSDGHPNNQVGSYVIGFEVFRNDDLDFQDVVYELSGVTAVPEPASMLGVAMCSAIAMMPRGRRAKTPMGFPAELRLG
jgi:hypothetical protein